MKKSIELRTLIKVEGKISEVNIVNNGSAVEIITEVKLPEEPEKGTDEYIEKHFPVVKVSSLSKSDDFLKYEPKNLYEENIKNSIVRIIDSKLPDFRAQRIDPSVDKNGKIFYEEGMMPGLGNSATWWDIKALNFLPEKNSRLGTSDERIAFLGLIIKYLMEKGYSKDEAWKAVCEESKNLGHYRDSKNSKKEFETTGCRRVGIWYDLANTAKITVKDTEKYIHAKFGGDHEYDSHICPLAYMTIIEGPELITKGATGWIVLSV